MEASEQGGAYDSLASEAAFSRCMDFLARMIQKYGPEIKFPDSEAEEQVGTEREAQSRLIARKEAELEDKLEKLSDVDAVLDAVSDAAYHS